MSETSQVNKDYPKFATQLEEDAYWADRHVERESRGLAAFANGTVTRGRAVAQIEELRARRNASASGPAEGIVRLDPQDVLRANELAAQRGVEYQEFVRGLVHDALERELSVAK